MPNEKTVAFRVLPIALAVLGLSACSTSVQMQPKRLPQALVEPLPMVAAVRITDSIAAFDYDEDLPTGEKIRINFGASSKTMFLDAFGDLFVECIELSQGVSVPANIDILIEPSVVAFEVALPSQSVNEDYTVWIRYDIKVYDKQGGVQAQYQLSAYGKAAGGFRPGDRKRGLTIAARRALRDAAVLLLTRFEKDAQLGIASAPSETPVETTS